jgi:hypothetical protein
MDIKFVNDLPSKGFPFFVYYVKSDGKYYGWDIVNRRFYNISTPNFSDIQGLSLNNLQEGDVLSYDSESQTWINKVIDTSSGVNSFNERQGDVYLLDSDVTYALGYTPENTSNKTSTIVGNETSETYFPTIKGVVDWVIGLGYITASSLTGYATQSWVISQGYITSSTLTGYATETWVNSRGYITNVVTALGYTPENTANKSTTITGNETSNTLFPTVKSVVDWVTSLFIKQSTNTTNYVQKTSGTGTIGDSQIFDNNNSIGIGTNSPATFLAGLSGLSLLKSAGAAISIAINSTNYFLQYISTSSQYIWYSSTVGRVATLFLNNGNFTLGSSTSDLGNKLDISGNLAIRNAQPRINLVSSPGSGGIVFWNDGSNRFAMGYQPIQGSEAAGSLNLYSYGSSSTILSILANGKILMGANNSSVTSARLEVVSTSQGFLPPKMTTAQKNAIVSPVSGLMVFDTTLNKLCVYSGTAWETITSA